MNANMGEVNTKLTNVNEQISANMDELNNKLTANKEELKSDLKGIGDKLTTMDKKFEEMEGRIESVENKFEDMESKLEAKIFEKVEEVSISFRSDLEKLKQKVMTGQGDEFKFQAPFSKPSIKLSTYDGKSSWQVYKTQFSIVADANQWDSQTKACQLAASLRADAADILQTLPETQRLDFDALVNALELRFGEKCVKDYSRLQLKSRQQKVSETLQELATDVERLSHLAFSDCPTEVREVLALQHFIDGVRDPEIQKALRMADLKDLKGALVFAMKFEAAQQATRKDRHPIRAVNESDTSNSSVERLERQMRSFMNRVESLMSQKADGKKTLKCWTCGREGHLQRSCRARQGAETNSASQKEVSQCVYHSERSGSKIKRETYLDPAPRGATDRDGEKIDIHGKLKVKIRFGDTTYQHAVYVADIADPFILGLDFLKEHGFTLDFNKNELRSIHEEVTIFKIKHRTESIRQVTANENITIPPRTEIIVPGYIGNDVSFNSGLIGSAENKANGLLIASTLVDLSRKTIPVRICNVTEKPRVFQKGEVLATCSPVTCVCKSSSLLLSNSPQQLTPDLLENAELSPEQKSSAERLFQEFEDVFSRNSSDIGHTTVTQHRIDTADHPPIKQHPRRLPFAKQEEVGTLLREMQENDIIEPSSSPWASPIVLVRKKDGSTRFCVDYRKLNDVTKKDSYPLPRIDDTLDTLSGHKWFSTLDLKSGYWQVEIHPEDREKTAFTSGQGLWQFKVMPFGLCNAPATFERLMETVLKGLTFEACLIYLDDVIIGGRTFEEHLQNIRKVLSKLSDANLKLNPSKCKFFQKEVNYLGHIISAEGVRTDPEKVSAVKNWKRPENLRELRSFLGLCTYYRKFVKGFSNIARPLHKLTESKQKFQWTKECEDSFLQLKEALTSSPILIYPQPDKPFILDTDASNESVGAVLSQEIDGQERVVAYWSKCLSKPERNYCVTRKELLAIVKAIEHFHHYLYGQKFLLRTDHASLTWLMNFRNTEGQVARWIQRLNEYYFDIRHRKGSSHGNADALSRRPCPENCRHCSRVETKYDYAIRQITTSTATPPDPWSDEKVREDQMADPDIKPLIEFMESSSNKPSWQDISAYSPTTKQYWALWNSLHLRNGVLYRKFESEDGKTFRWQLVLPRSRIPEVLKELHGSPTGGHFGVMKTLHRVRERFCWGKVRADVEQWCKSCDACSARKGPKIRSRGKLHRYNVGAPFERIAFDILGPLPRTASGNKYLLVVMDYFTKWPEVYPIPDQEAPTVAEAVVQHWISRYGVPLQLHSDQGRNFVSAVLKGVCELLGIDKTKTTPLHPQSDGMVERFNRTILNNLSLMVSKNQQDWDQKVPLFLLAYRSAVHETTGYSPSQMLFGRDLRLPCDLLFGRPPDTPSSPEEYVQNLQARFEDVHNLARERINLRTEKMKTRYDTKATGHQFKEGDKVWFYNPTRRKGLSPKLQSHWDGPYTILKIINDVVIRIRKSTNSKPRVVHYDRLAPYYGHNS
ncbi:retrovirus-related Pol polyprotein from transposon 412 [Trichonephila clavipes]|uniref:RNA-directed DNA polymerase n=2 Tax=Trichonephila clavipes TaxID=2585209 RepID=A0A8X6SRV3_TRICX|nr:retrovirus-related Pol polyprotein from transposon 412 [Trichonephila clavipes]